jgi:cytochrome c5
MKPTRKSTQFGAVPIVVAALIAMMAAFTTAGAETAANMVATTGQVTFAKDVAPILQEKCQTCHRAGGIAPMPLISYQDVRPWAKAVQIGRAHV